MRKGQGAIEYLLIIGAAILVVAILVVVLINIVGTGKTQSTESKNSYINSLSELEKIKLQSEGKLTLNAPLTTNVIVPILMADGTPITTQEQLNQAFANGEITIYKNGVPITSNAQIPGTQLYTLNITGCYGGSKQLGYKSDMLSYSNSESQSTFSNKIGKIVSVAGNQNYSNLIGKKYPLIAPPSSGSAKYYCCGACGTNKCVNLDPSKFSMTNAQCPVSSNWATPGNTTNGWQIEVYEKDIVAGTADENSEIGIDLMTGQFSANNENLTKTNYYSCNYSGKWCWFGPPYDSACQGDSTCAGQCPSSTTLPTEVANSCLSPNCVTICNNEQNYCECQTNTYEVPIFSIDYFHGSN